MRAVVCREHASPASLTVVEDHPDPVVGPGHLLVDVAGAGVNFVDALFVRGTYQIKIPPPFVPGMEVAGTVAEVGPGVEGWSAGDRVVAMCGIGGYAERVVVSAASAARVPDGIELTTAAAVIQSYCTARFALEQRARLTAGEIVLVLGAGGGVGLAAIDVAHAAGAHVIAAASTDDKRRAALEAGAEAAIDTSSEDLKTAARARAAELAPERAERDGRAFGVDVAVDTIGGPATEAALRATGFDGRLLVIGFASGDIAALPANLVLLNNRSVVGVDWGAWTMGRAAEQSALLGSVLDDLTAGRLHAASPELRPLDSAAAALTDLEGRRVTGKLVLTP